MYILVKIWVRVALQFYCRKVDFNYQQIHSGNEPLILACTHPNSFFDALVIGAYHPRKMYFLARGDAFKKKWAATLLRMLNMIPIYRLSEGKENLENNNKTFADCIDILKGRGAVLIFSEGISINEWKLRKLKKGTARLAHMCWQDHDIKDMIVQPVGINYDTFTKVPKTVYVEHTTVLKKDSFILDNVSSFYKDFNEQLTGRLLPLSLLENDTKLNSYTKRPFLKALLAVPAFIGWLTHKPFYNVWRKYIWSKTKGTVFFDSVLFASMLILYPIIVLLLTVITMILTGNSAFLSLFFLLPFVAWSYKQYKSS